MALFETFLFFARPSDGWWVVGWLMSELAVCLNGGFPWVLGALIKSWHVKLVDIMLVFSFSPFVFCFCASCISLEKLLFEIFRTVI